MNALLEEFITYVDEQNKENYIAIANKAIELGFKPKRDKTKYFSISFFSSKYKVTILRMTNEKAPAFRLKFFATKNYSSIFDQSIKAIIEKYNFKYVGCYGCGRCKNEKQGYIVKYNDGKNYFRCGFELIEIITINDSIAKEALTLLENQASFYNNELANNSCNK